MQTLDFTRALTEIVKVLKVQELVALLNNWLGPPPANPTPQQIQQYQQAQISETEKDRFSSLIFDSHAGYDWLLRSDVTRKILQGLNAQELYEPTRMRRLLFSVSNASQVVNVRQNNPEIYDVFETLKSFLRMEVTCRTLLQDEKIGAMPSSDGILELQVIDYDGNGIEAPRLEKVILTLIELHANVSRLLGIKNDNLRFRYFDSGSDVVIGVTAVTGLIAVLGPLLLQFWDKVRFRKQENFGKDIEALSKGLEFIGKVQEAVEKQALTSEEARNLKSRIFTGVNDLIGLGVTLPLGDSMVDQRQLLIDKRDVKLLGTGEPPEITTSSETP